MYIDMSDLLEEWEKPITFITRSKGEYVGGRWVPGGEEIREEKPATFVPLSNDDLRLEENGSYTRKDGKLYTRYPVDIDTEIMHNGQRYKIDGQRDYSDHSNVWANIAVWINQGGEDDGNNGP